MDENEDAVLAAFLSAVKRRTCPTSQAGLDQSANDTTQNDTLAAALPQQPTDEQIAAGQGLDDEEDFVPHITSMRCVVTTKEAGIILGNESRKVADTRAKSGAKVTHHLRARSGSN